MSAPKFKVGDKVRVVDSAYQLVVGGEYTVTGTADGLVQIDHPACVGGWYPSRFELVKPDPEVEYTFRRKRGRPSVAQAYGTKEQILEHLRTKGEDGADYELLEVRSVALVTPKRVVEIDE